MANKLKKKSSIQKVVKKQVVAGHASTKAADHKGETARTFTLPGGSYQAAVGRRKTATARVRIYTEPGDFVVNGMLVSEYFQGIINAPTLYNLPLQLTDLQGKFAITVKVSGAGLRAQIDAVCHGMARALIKINPELRGELKKNGLLTRDDRMRETRKIGMGGKARRVKQSPKR